MLLSSAPCVMLMRVLYLQNSSLPADMALRSPRCSAIFADQAADDLHALDPAGDIDGVVTLAQRTFLPQPLVRTLPL